MSIVGQPNRNTKGLRPWRPGESGNARGRQTTYREVLRLARANSPDAIRILIKCMNDENAPWASRVAAANGLLDRAWGKSKEHLQIDGEGGTPLLRITFVDEVDATTVTVQTPTAESESGEDDTLQLSFEKRK